MLSNKTAFKKLVRKLQSKYPQAQSKNRNGTIIKFYQPVIYIMKNIDGYFKIHYSSINRVLAPSKKMQDGRPDNHIVSSYDSRSSLECMLYT